MRISFTHNDLLGAADLLIHQSETDGQSQLGVVLLLLADSWRSRVMINRPAQPETAAR